MKIELWLDYLCPITYLTHKNLIKALNDLNINNYEILYRSFEMIEYCSEDYKIMDVWKLHHNQSSEEIEAFLRYKYPDFEKLTYMNVNGAHQLSHLSKRFNVAQDVNTDILKAIFEDGKDIGNVELLVEIGNRYGMCRELIESTIDNNTFSEQISLNRENAFMRGIDRIPHLRINIKNHHNGYLSVDDLKEVLISNCNEIEDNSCCIGQACNF